VSAPLVHPVEEVADGDVSGAEVQGVRDVEENYGPNMINLVLSRGYLAQPFGNSRPIRYL
jgi:hypothetical protein